MPMHVGAMQLFELPAAYRGNFAKALRKHVAERLPLLRPMRQKLWWMPLNIANPAWVDAAPDLQQHIVELKLPKAARSGDGLAALEAEVGRLHSQLMERSRPLWKMFVFTGLGPSADGRKRIALYTQLHHAAVDGQAAVALANVLFDLQAKPAPRAMKVSTRPKIYRLEMTEMMRGVLGRQAQQVAKLIKELPGTVGTLTGAARQAVARSALAGGSGVSNLTLAPRMPTNAHVGIGRAFAGVSLPLPELKALGKAHGATINDMVLMVCGGALRRFYGKRRTLPRKSLVAAVPVSLREKGDTNSDNQASMSLMSLGTHIADPHKRLAHVLAATAAMKAMVGSVKSILPTDFPSLGVPWLLEAVSALVGRTRAAERVPLVANLVISNVPGPPVPLYLAGARMLHNHPTSIVTHGLGLNITVQSYDQWLDFGLVAGNEALPEVRELADEIVIAFDDLRALPLPGEGDSEQGAQVRERLSRAVGSTLALPAAAQRAARSAVKKAVSKATGRARASAPTKRTRGR
jgi:WS/DGAT/MGAT family acyltransferase